jgi:hypothetical protein
MKTSVAEPEPHHFEGAGAVTRWGFGSVSGTDGSMGDVQQGYFSKNTTNLVVLSVFYSYL